MCPAHPASEIEYPETDGQPMGETDWHIDALIRLREILKRRYRGHNVYVGSDLLVYHDEGNPHHFVVPHVFVALDCSPNPRRVFKTWEENRVPDVVFEVTSRSSAREDAVFKPRTYERLGVRELFLYDPTGDDLRPPLQGFRLVGRDLKPVERPDDGLVSHVLGLKLTLQGQWLALVDPETGQEQLTEAEAERIGRQAAEAELSELRAEVERLRRQSGKRSD